MANRMNPGSPLPGAVAVNAARTELMFGDRAEAARRAAELAPAAPAHRKPLRQRKERLPVADEVDLAQVRNAGASAGAALALAPLAPPAAPAVSPPPATVFDGLVDDDTAIPPDTMGAVGPQHLFNPLNNGILILNRTGSRLHPPMLLNDFWKSLEDPIEVFDPRAAFDPYQGRFLFTCVANSESPRSSLLIGVTKTDDPTGSWTLSIVKVDPAVQGPIWLDFPSIGFSADKVTVQVNMYSIAGNTFQGSSIYVWDKASLYDPPYQPAVRLFVLADQGACQVPAHTYDSGETTQYLISRWANNIAGSGSYAIYEITGGVAAGTVALSRTGFVQATGTSWDSAAAADFAPQLGSADLIDAGDDRILSALYRNGSLWATHTAFLPAGGATRTSAQWLQIDTNAWSLRQLGRVDDPSGATFYAFPSLAVNSADDALLGLARFSAQQFASGAYAYRAAADAPGQMRDPVVYAPGQASYFKTFGTGKNRWGDYSRTQVDPVDDTHFWTIQEYASAQTDHWATKWAQVP